MRNPPAFNRAGYKGTLNLEVNGTAFKTLIRRAIALNGAGKSKSSKKAKS